jgi:hypothetical protein
MINKDQPNGLTTEVKDLSLAAYLYSTRLVKLIGQRKLNNGIILFQFTPKEKVDELLSLYWNLQAPPIQPKQLFNAQRDLKDIIFGT